MTTVRQEIKLGLGLLSIGRKWGYKSESPPPEHQAHELIAEAISLGITFFDTAPAYGPSERLFGKYLQHSPSVMKRIIIATKMGEHWASDQQCTYIDHSYDALGRSIEQSVRLLGRVDVLQLHKASSSNVGSPSVIRAIEYARDLGIKQFGVSVSDFETARAACAVGVYSFIQFPFNRLSSQLKSIFGLTREMTLLINRPFAMGQLILGDPEEKNRCMQEALAFICAEQFSGYVLVGTKSASHLVNTFNVFQSLKT